VVAAPSIVASRGLAPEDQIIEVINIWILMLEFRGALE